MMTSLFFNNIVLNSFWKPVLPRAKVTTVLRRFIEKTLPQKYLGPSVPVSDEKSVLILKQGPTLLIQSCDGDRHIVYMPMKSSTKKTQHMYNIDMLLLLGLTNLV